MATNNFDSLFIRALDMASYDVKRRLEKGKKKKKKSVVGG